MKKGVVLEHKVRSTIVFTSEGEFVKARKIPDAKVGEEAFYEKKPGFSLNWMPPKKFSAFAIVLAFLLAFVPAYLWYGNDKTYAYVNIDINPSFEAKINRELEVISLEAADDEAQVIIKNMEEWEGKKLAAVTSQLCEAVNGDGASGEENVLLGISYLAGKEELEISKNVRQFLAQEEEAYEAAVYTVPSKWKEEAEKVGKTVNSLVNERITASEEVTEIEDDVKDVIRMFFESKKD
ncbi:anti-sigma factor domain-containing protein [Salimicrobium album]|uniref:Anti-sigma factor N-terminus n=1 Tax=Salimicrobium album TaxID=50717 RepID=A0A1H3C3R6_9BACI|nr:anti-sigma factor domain-containing protein [Salimicrobium album]SDX48274.1 Anti-sigma factor N-terminus [Salimicrobium album]